AQRFTESPRTMESKAWGRPAVDHDNRSALHPEGPSRPTTLAGDPEIPPPPRFSFAHRTGTTHLKRRDDEGDERKNPGSAVAGRDRRPGDASGPGGAEDRAVTCGQGECEYRQPRRAGLSARDR